MFKDALRTTNNSIIIAVPLILFIKIMDLYSTFTLYRADTPAKFSLAACTMIFMTGVFAAMYFDMIKQAVEISKKVFIIDADRTKEILGIFKNIWSSTSKYCLSFVGAYLIFFGIQIILTPFVYILGVKLIGHISPELLQNIQAVASDSNAVSAFVDKLTVSELTFFAKWSLLLIIVTLVVMFVLMLWIPEIMYNRKNPLMALFSSVAKVFKDFLSSLKLYSTLCLIGFLIFCLISFSTLNLVTYFIGNFALYYFYLYITILIFVYYGKKYNTEENEE